MKIKTSELTGPALDWAAVIAKGVKPSDIRITRGRIYRWHRDEDGNLTNSYETGPEFAPSKMWESGGPIIERERLHLCPVTIDDVPAWHAWSDKHKKADQADGPTPLIAAMRCFVASKLGDEVDVPEELMS